MTEFEIGGVRRGFRLGTYTFKLIRELTGIQTIEEVFQKLQEKQEDFAMQFYFCCAKHWHMSNKLPIDFEEVHIYDWLEELGHKKVSEISTELIKVYISKNLVALETGPQQSSNGTLSPSSS